MTSNKLHEEILQRLTVVETKLDQLITETIPHILKLHEEQIKNLHGRVNKLEQTQSYMNRTIMGLIFGGVITGIVQIIVMNIK